MTRNFRHKILSAFIARGMLAAWFTLIVSLSLTVWAWHLAQAGAEQKARDRFYFRIDEVKTAIADRLRDCEAVLRGAQGLFDASDDVTRKEWRAYVQSLKLDQIYPGIQGIGFAKRIMATEKNAHIRRIRTEGFPGYTIWPRGARDEYLPIVYLEPFAGRNLRAFGYDTASEPVRRTAMEQARDTGEAAISGKIALVQETDENKQAGFIMYLPIYRKGVPTNAVEARRAGLSGYVYIAFRMDDLMRGTLNTNTPDVDIEIFDGPWMTKESLMYDHDFLARFNRLNDDAVFSHTMSMHTHDHIWTLHFSSLPVFEASIDKDKPRLVLAGGAFISLLFFALAWSLVSGRASVLAANENLKAEVAEREREKEMLRKTAEALSVATDESFFRELVLHLSKALQVDYAFVGELDPNRSDTVRTLAFSNAGRIVANIDYHLTHDTPCGSVECKSVCHFPIGAQKLFPEDDLIYRYGVETFIGHPLFDSTGRLLGLLVVMHEKPIADVDHVRSLLRICAGRVVAELERKRTDETLSKVARAVSSVTGEEFFRTLVIDTARALQVDFAFVGELCSDNKDAVNTVAVNVRGRIVDNFIYDLHGTPCRHVVGKSPCEYPSGVQQLFPEDRMLVEMGIESYVGYPLYDSANRALGLLAVMDSKPIKEPQLVQTVLQICASRAAAELERRQAEAQMRQLSSAVEQTADAVVITDRHGVIQYVNPAYEQVTGYSLKEVQGKNASVVKSGEHDKSFYEELWRTILAGRVFRGVMVNRKKDGSLYYEEKTISPLKDAGGGIVRFVSTGKDITERLQSEERLHHLAHHDPLTGLPNRVLLEDRIEHAMREADRNERLVAVLFLDLDRFKTINDTLGHPIGDAMLKAVAERLATCLRAGDTVSRLGGDEFTIVLANVAHVDDVTRVAQKILDQFISPFRVGGRDLFVSPSIGITLYPLDEKEPENLLKDADVAMYHAKELGGNVFQFYTPALNARAARRLELETGLRHALERREFILHYQPLVDMQTGRIRGMEALLRWQHPEFGLIPPLDFIPLAEETGLIIPIGEWVLKTACAQIKAWHDTGFPALQVAVNLSSKQLRDKNLIAAVRKALTESGIEPRYLDLELTESVLMQDMELAAMILKELKTVGVSFSLDDFGTGYSSLSYLKRFPIDYLKIDRSFVRDITTDPVGAGLVKAIIAMANVLHIKVIAEGVETYEQLEFLRRHGCDITQGYFCSKPIAAEEFTELLQDWDRLRAGKCSIKDQ